jgi:hypothetical protein
MKLHLLGENLDLQYPDLAGPVPVATSALSSSGVESGSDVVDGVPVTVGFSLTNSPW